MDAKGMRSAPGVCLESDSTAYSVCKTLVAVIGRYVAAAGNVCLGRTIALSDGLLALSWDLHLAARDDMASAMAY